MNNESTFSRPTWPRYLLIALDLPAAYITSYVLLGRHTSGENWMPRYTYHDRAYGFDPWIYQPLAYTECKLRGRGGQVTQVVLDGSPGRDGSAIYGFWSDNRP